MNAKKPTIRTNKKKLLILSIIILLGSTLVTSLAIVVYKQKYALPKPRPCTTYNSTHQYTITGEQCAEDYIGLTREEALAKAHNARHTPDIIRINGSSEGYEGTIDLGGPHINLELKDGVVIKSVWDHF